MQFILISLATLHHLLFQVSAHYTFPWIEYNGTRSGEWEFVRETDNAETWRPIINVKSDQMLCYNTELKSTANTLQVLAGSAMQFCVGGWPGNGAPVPGDPSNPATTYHPSVNNVYMAKAPDGLDVADFDGRGNVWFKIHEDTAYVTDDRSEIIFPAQGSPSVNFTVPHNVPDGQYLIRVENIALHQSYFGEPQFFLACGQVEVIGGGNGVPGPLVSFPGAYTGEEPGIATNIFFPYIPEMYVHPGPPIWG